MTRLFETDDVCGVVNQKLTAELVLNLSAMAVHILDEAGVFRRRQSTALVTRDPHAFGESLEAAVCAGLASAGADVLHVRVALTPTAAYLVGEYRIDLGVIISASHNGMLDSDIRLFVRGGVKLDDSLENTIERRMGEEWQRPVDDRVGRTVNQHQVVESYLSHLVKSLRTGELLSGLTIILDCASGASYETAITVFEVTGASMTAIHASPDGISINTGCSSTRSGDLQKAALSSSVDLGLAFDGDANRCPTADHKNNLTNGGQILAILALALQEDHWLVSDTIAVTVMSNLGLRLTPAEHDIRIDQTRVGDHYVLESMSTNGSSLGGGQSGHVTMNEFATTDDNILTDLHPAKWVATTGKPLKELASVMTELPQVVTNVRGADKLHAGIDNEATAAVADANHELGKSGCVLLRSSDTKPVVRVTVEIPTDTQARKVAERLVVLVKKRLAI